MLRYRTKGNFYIISYKLFFSASGTFCISKLNSFFLSYNIKVQRFTEAFQSFTGASTDL